LGVRTTEGLKTIIDTHDVFMAGHRIVKIRRQKRPVPEWARHQKQIRGLLLRSFPRLATDQKQRKRAARWARIIHLFFVLGHTYSQVAGELDEQLLTVHKSINHIRNASRGLRPDGSGPYRKKH